MKSRAATTRRGTTLVEMVAVISGVAVVLSVSATMLHRAMQAESRTRYFFDEERTALRLADQFRRDVHRAVEARVEGDDAGDGVLLQLELTDNQSVAYSRDGGSVIRTLVQKDAPTAREAYQLSPVGELSLREDQSPRRLVLAIVADPQDALPTLEKPAPGIREQPISFQMEAVLGRDWRFARPTNEQGDVP